MTESQWVGSVIKRARLERGYTQQELGKMVGIATIHMKNIEAGRRTPSTPVLLNLCRILHLSVDELAFHTDRIVLNVDGLSEEQISALARLILTMKSANGWPPEGDLSKADPIPQSALNPI